MRLQNISYIAQSDHTMFKFQVWEEDLMNSIYRQKRIVYFILFAKYVSNAIFYVEETFYVCFYIAPFPP